MQKIEAENNLSETAFIKVLAPNRYEIHWFSPITEIDFCGHATLAFSYVIFNHFGCHDEIEFLTLNVGSLLVNWPGDVRVEVSFPNQCPEPVADIPQALFEGLPYKPVQVLTNRQAYFAVMSSEEEVRTVDYQSEPLKSLALFDVVVISQAGEYDFISRYFGLPTGRRGTCHRLNTFGSCSVLDRAIIQNRSGCVPGFQVWWCPVWQDGW